MTTITEPKDHELPTLQVTDDEFREVAYKVGWEDRTVDLLLRGGAPKFKVRCGKVMYVIRDTSFRR